MNSGAATPPPFLVMTSEDERRRDAEEDNSSAAGFSRSRDIPHFCETLAFNVLFISLSFLLSTLAVRLRLVIFRACSMFRSAAPVSRSPSLSFCALHTHTHTHTYVHAYTIASLLIPPRGVSFSFFFFPLSLTTPFLRPGCYYRGCSTTTQT